jgi:hypothetical protein
MTREDVANVNPEALIADGLDAALIGVTDTGTAVYSIDKIIEILMTRDGMDDEEADEWFGFNIAGAHFGEHDPVYVNLAE